MIETVLAILAFVAILLLAVVEISNGMTIRRLKKTIDDMYFTIASDRSDIYKELDKIEESYNITQIELEFLAARCNEYEKCQCKEDTCKKEQPVQKPKRPRLPKK